MNGIDILMVNQFPKFLKLFLAEIGVEGIVRSLCAVAILNHIHKFNSLIID